MLYKSKTDILCFVQKLKSFTENVFVPLKAKIMGYSNGWELNYIFAMCMSMH